MTNTSENRIYQHLLAAKRAEFRHLPLQTPSDPPIDVLVADHTVIFYRGIAETLAGGAPGCFTITGGVSTGRGLIEKLKSHRPHVVLIDVSMPQGNGIDATAWIKKHYPEIKLLATSDAQSPVEVQMMVRAGADGFIAKACNTEELVLAIRAVHAGGRYFGIGVQTHLALDEINGITENGAR